MRIFTDEVWTGGSYELMLEYDQGSADLLVRGLQQIWRLDDVTGCYLDGSRDPDDQTRFDFEPSLLAAGHLLGLATLPGGVRVPCGTCCLQESDGSGILIFYCPVTGLGHAFPVGGFPFDGRDHESWRVPLDNWLAGIGRRVFECAPFKLGLVGFETDSIDAASLGKSNVPQQRYDGLLLPDAGGLAWYPRTES